MSQIDVTLDNIDRLVNLIQVNIYLFLLFLIFLFALNLFSLTDYIFRKISVFLLPVEDNCNDSKYPMLSPFISYNY